MSIWAYELGCGEGWLWGPNTKVAPAKAIPMTPQKQLLSLGLRQFESIRPSTCRKAILLGTAKNESSAMSGPGCFVTALGCETALLVSNNLSSLKLPRSETPNQARDLTHVFRKPFCSYSCPSQPWSGLVNWLITDCWLLTGAWVSALLSSLQVSSRT